MTGKFLEGPSPPTQWDGVSGTKILTSLCTFIPFLSRRMLWLLYKTNRPIIYRWIPFTRSR